MRSVYWRVGRLLRNRDKIRQLADASGRVESSSRKGRLKRCLDLIYIALKWDEYSTAYSAQGIDRRGKSVRRDLITSGRFTQIRDRFNHVEGRAAGDYSVVFNDKALFERYFGGQGIPVIPSYGLVDTDCLLVPWDGPAQSIEEAFSSHTAVDLFCKPLSGKNGRGGIRVRKSDVGWQWTGAGCNGSAPARLDEPYILQPRVVQDPHMAAIHQASLNTLRVYTCLASGGQVKLFGGFLRMGAAGSVVDNASAGGVACGYDLETGRLFDSGYQFSKLRVSAVDSHPTTGTRFAGFQIPDFPDVVDLVKRAHACAPWVRTVGWDVAISADGPILVEGNHTWGPVSLMWIDADFVGTVQKIASGTI